MALTIAEKLQRRREKQKQSMERARAKQIAKMNDPEEREKRFKKQLQQQERQRQRQIERLNDPEYQKKQRDKQQQRIERQKAKPVAKKPTKKIASKGLKGRPPTAEEKRAQYPDMIPIHAKGKYGGKAQWKIQNGTETELLFKVYKLSGLPLELLENIYPQHSEH
ncbi:hypothetical protein [Vibrio diabolicus]